MRQAFPLRLLQRAWVAACAGAIVATFVSVGDSFDYLFVHAIDP